MKNLEKNHLQSGFHKRLVTSIIRKYIFSNPKTNKNDNIIRKYLISHYRNYEIINENDIPILERLADLPPQIRSTLHQKMLLNNHTDANIGKIKGYLYLEDIFGFCETLKKITENLGFHLMFKTNDLQNIIYSSMAVDLIVTIINLYLYVPNLIPSVETQVLFNEATQKTYKISCDVWYTERRVISDMITEADIGSSQKVKSPLYLIGAHKTRARAETANKKINNAYLIISIFLDIMLR